MRKCNHIPFESDAVGSPPPPLLRVVTAAPQRAPALPGEALGQILPGTDINAAASYLATLSPSGRRSMRARLDRAARMILAGSSAGAFPWGALRYEHLVYVRTRLQMEGASDSTVNMTLVALRQTARAARQLGQMTPEAEASLRDVKSVRLERLPRGRMLPPGEREALFRTCARDRTARGRRDACLLALALGCGLRREELATVPVTAFDPRALTVRLTGKGNKEAVLPLKTKLARAVLAWLDARGDAPGPLLSPVTRSGGALAGSQLSDQAIYRIVLRLCRESGIARATPHDLRRTYISDLLDLTDGETARDLARHENFSTTGRYSRRGERTRRAAVERLYVPYRKPPARPRPKRTPRRARKSRRRRFRRGEFK